MKKKAGILGFIFTMLGLFAIIILGILIFVALSESSKEGLCIEKGYAGYLIRATDIGSEWITCVDHNGDLKYIKRESG